MSNQDPGFELRLNPEYAKAQEVEMNFHPGAIQSNQIVGNVPEEAKETLLRLFETLKSEDFDAHGEFRNTSGTHIKWEYLKATKVMLISIPRPDEVVRHRSGATTASLDVVRRLCNPEGHEVKIYQDPGNRHLHASMNLVTACGQQVTDSWTRYEGFQQVTCNRCRLAIEGPVK